MNEWPYYPPQNPPPYGAPPGMPPVYPPNGYFQGPPYYAPPPYAPPMYPPNAYVPGYPPYVGYTPLLFPVMANPFTPTLVKKDYAPDEEVLRMAGGPLTFYQFEKTEDRDRPPMLLMIAAGLLYAIAFFLAVSIGGSDGNNLINVVFLIMALCGAGLAIGAAGAASSRRKKRIRRQYEGYFAACQFGTGTVVYGDRIEQWTAYTKNVLYLNGGTQLIQSRDVLTVQNKLPNGQLLRIFFRAEDLTENNTQTLYNFLYYKLQPENRLFEANFVPRQWGTPPGYPVLQKEEALASAECPSMDSEKRLFSLLAALPGLLLAAGALAMVFGPIFSYLFPLVSLSSNLFMAYVAVVTVFLFGAISAIGLTVSRHFDSYITDDINTVFTASGLIAFDGVETFIPPALIRVRYHSDETLVLNTPFNNYVITWEWVENPEKLKMLLNLSYES